MPNLKCFGGGKRRQAELDRLQEQLDEAEERAREERERNRAEREALAEQLREIREQEAARLEKKRLKHERLERERIESERLAEEARIEHLRLEEEARVAEELARIERERLEEETRIERERLEEEARIESERVAEEARLERERLKEEARIAKEEARRERDRLEEEARVERERLEEEALIELQRVEEEARAERERLVEEARVERERLEEEARVERARLEEIVRIERQREAARAEKGRAELEEAIAAQDIQRLHRLVAKYHGTEALAHLLTHAKQLLAKDEEIQRRNADARRRAKNILKMSGEDWKTLSGLKKLKEAMDKAQDAVRTADFDMSKWVRMHEAGVKRLEDIMSGVDATTQAASALVKNKSDNLEELQQCREDMNKYVYDAYEAELATIHEEKLKVADAFRKKLHNRIQDVRGNTRVFVRVRPRFDDEPKEVYFKKTLLEIQVIDPATTKDQTFQFDAVFDKNNDQDTVFADCEELVMSVLDGYNATVFAYGQTGSGKTHTMFGTNANAGVVSHSVTSLFHNIEEQTYLDVSVDVTMTELYNNKVIDLLNPKWIGAADKDKEGHKVRYDPTSGEVFLDPLPLTRPCLCAKDVDRVLADGLAQRRVAFTMLNTDSSRSHLFLVFTVTTRDRETGEVKKTKLTLVDLAGSERIKKSFAEGQQQTEAIQINTSLTALGDVFAALTSGKKKSEVPYRNHKLTQMLQDSLGGTSKTIMFVCARPDDSNIDETLMSLKYAQRARNIINNSRVAAHAHRQPVDKCLASVKEVNEPRPASRHQSMASTKEMNESRPAARHKSVASSNRK